MPLPDSNANAPPVRHFVTTHWTVVLSAGRSDSVAARDSLEELCRTYWYPLYVFVRRQGYSVDDAQDLTQAFFMQLLTKDYLADVDRAKGRFRSFLLASLKHFLANEWDKVRAQKRGGGHVLVPLDARSADSRYALEPVDNSTADKLYERRWALTLLDAALAELREEFAADGRSKLFDELKFTLTGDRGSLHYADLAATLGTSEGAVKVAVHRLRERYREVLRKRIAATVEKASDVEDELRHLFQALVAV